MPNDIVLSIPNEDVEFATSLERDSTLGAVRLPGAGMDGGAEYLVYIIPLTHFAAKIVVDLLKAHWERVARVKVELDGMTFSGASIEEISEFLEKHPPKK